MSRNPLAWRIVSVVKRETRANLWFLIVFMAISLPGAAILFRKKLDPNASRMDVPDTKVARLPYMAPLPAPEGVKWIVPPKTQAWLKELVKSKTGSDQVLSSLPPGPEWEPVISADHRLQPVACRTGADAIIYDLLIWSAPNSDRAFSVIASGHACEVRSVDAVPIPQDVRKEWVGLGYTHPPSEATWIEAAEAHLPTPQSRSITVSGSGVSPAIDSSVEFNDWLVEQTTTHPQASSNSSTP
jgi:hypothetical protein